MFFGDGRKPLLDFLRNLTPQIVMLAIAIVASSKLDLNKFDLTIDGLQRTLPFAMCLFVFFASLMANFSTFLEDSLMACKKRELVPFITDESTGLPRIAALLSDVWLKHKLAVCRMVLVMVVAEAAMCVVFIMSIQSAALSPYLAK